MFGLFMFMLSDSRWRSQRAASRPAPGERRGRRCAKREGGSSSRKLTSEPTTDRSHGS